MLDPVHHLGVGYVPPTFTSDVIHVMCAPIFRQSSTPMYYCERKQNVKTGEAWEQGVLSSLPCDLPHRVWSLASIFDIGVVSCLVEAK